MLTSAQDICLVTNLAVAIHRLSLKNNTPKIHPTTGITPTKVSYQIPPPSPSPPPSLPTFTGTANNTMNPFSVDLQGLGIEFLNKIVSVFYPKWPRSLHMAKKIKLYKFVCHPDTPVTLYAAKFNSIQKELLYNAIFYPLKISAHNSSTNREQSLRQFTTLILYQSNGSVKTLTHSS